MNRARGDRKLPGGRSVVLLMVASAACGGGSNGADGSSGSNGRGGSGGTIAAGGGAGGSAGVGASGGRGGAIATGLGGGVAGAGAFGGSGGTIAAGGAGGSAAAGGVGGAAGAPAVSGMGGPPSTGLGGNNNGSAGAGGAGLQNGIGPGSAWKSNVVSHTAGPYAPCGVVGSGPVAAAAASPTSDEIAVGSRAGIVLFYSPETGKQIRAPFYAAAAVGGVAYSVDGTELVVASDGGVQVVDDSTGAVTWSANPFTFSTRAASLSPDGTLIAALGWDTKPLGQPTPLTLRLLRVSDKQVVASVGDPTQPLNGTIDQPDHYPPQFSPDGTFLAVGSQLLSVPTLSELAISPLAAPGNQSITNSAVSPDGTLVAEGGAIWRVATGEVLKPAPSATQTVAVAFSPAGDFYAELDLFPSLTLHLYSTQDWSSEVTNLNLNSLPTGLSSDDGLAGTYWFLFSGDGSHLMVMLQQLDVASPPGAAVFQVLEVPALTLGAIATERLPFYGRKLVFSPDGSVLAGTSDVGLTLWNDDGTPHAQFSQQAQSVQFLANGMLMFNDGGIHDPMTGQALAWTNPPWLWVTPDGRFAATYWVTSTFVNVADASTISTFANLAPQVLDDFEFSSDNVLAAHSSLGGPVAVFDTASGSLLTNVTSMPPLAVATRGPTSGLLVGLNDATDLRVWSIPGGLAQYDIPGGTFAAFSADGSLLAVAANDGIRILESDSGTVRQTLLAHVDPLASPSGTTYVAFSPTGQIASLGYDSTVRLWCSP